MSLSSGFVLGLGLSLFLSHELHLATDELHLATDHWLVWKHVCDKLWVYKHLLFLCIYWSKIFGLCVTLVYEYVCGPCHCCPLPLFCGDLPNHQYNIKQCVSMTMYPKSIPTKCPRHVQKLDHLLIFSTSKKGCAQVSMSIKEVIVMFHRIEKKTMLGNTVISSNY